MLLAGDLGGTKTNLAIFSPEAGLQAPLAEATFRSADYPSLEAVAREFLQSVAYKVERASFGVAGPVVNGQATITNLPWAMNEQQLAEALNVSAVSLLNDLVAIANAVPYLASEDLYTLNEGQPSPNGTLAVVAPGTGLGEAFLVWDGGRYKAFPSEGGHAAFAPTNDLEDNMLRYLRGKFGHVSYERVCSGKGIPNIYEFLKESGYAPEPEWLTNALASASDPTPVIMNAAQNNEERPCELCLQTFNMFLDILAAEAGNMALKVLATGGVYLGGGIPPRICSAINQEEFLNVFRNKGRFTKILSNIPIHIILNPKAALLGAAGYGLTMMNNE